MQPAEAFAAKVRRRNCVGQILEIVRRSAVVLLCGPDSKRLLGRQVLASLPGYLFGGSIAVVQLPFLILPVPSKRTPEGPRGNLGKFGQRIQSQNRVFWPGCEGSAAESARLRIDLAGS
jgi:hypothetical protein